MSGPPLFYRHGLAAAIMKWGTVPFNLKDFHQTTRDAKKIIVVDMGFLGDTVYLVPALWELKDHYPRAELHVVTAPVGAEVLRMAPCVYRAWPVTLDPAKRSLGEQWNLIRDLRRERFDVAFNFNGGDRTVFATALIRPRVSVAYQSARKHFWQPWLIRHWILKRPLPTPVYEGRRHILELCGFRLTPARFDLRVPAEDRRWAESSIPRDSVHLSLSASSPRKEWPLPNSIQLIRRLLATPGRRIVVTAAANDRERARVEQVRREIADDRLLIIQESLTVTRLAALLERCALHVGPDSGVIHLAAALNISTVAIFRRYHDMAEWIPPGPRHVQFDAPCQCVNVREPVCATSNISACLAGISAEAVAEAIDRRLAV